jgi:hypothetical protein
MFEKNITILDSDLIEREPRRQRALWIASFFKRRKR